MSARHTSLGRPRRTLAHIIVEMFWRTGLPWSSRNGRYAYYHCWHQCRAVNVTKAKLEGLFAEELKQLQPTPGYMRVVKELVLEAWQERKTEITHEADDTARRAKAIQQTGSIKCSSSRNRSTSTYKRHRQASPGTHADIDRRTPAAVSEIDVEGISAFQNAFYRGRRTVGTGVTEPATASSAAVFPRGHHVRLKTVVRTGVSTHAFKYLTPVEPAENNLASPVFASWNRLAGWLRQVEGLRRVA